MLDLGYTKRSLSGALNDLSAGGMLGTLKFGNTIRYALRNHEPLRQLLDPLPDTPSGGWSHLFALAASLLSAQRRTHGKSITTQAVEVRKVLEPRRSLLERSHVELPELSTGDPWPQIDAWMEPLLRP